MTRELHDADVRRARRAVPVHLSAFRVHLVFNVATDVRVARDAGYDGIELWIPKLIRYLDAGYSVGELAGLLADLRVTMLDVLLPIETPDGERRRQLLELCERVAPVAARLECHALQVVR